MLHRDSIGSLLVLTMAQMSPSLPDKVLALALEVLAFVA